MPPDRKTKCLEDLRLRILTQDIAPGADLDETAVGEAYGLSRTPVREIFQRLAGEGYLAAAQTRGVKVSSMDLAVMRVFFQTAPMVYANVARLAAENRRDDEVEVLRAIQAEFRAAAEAGDAARASLLNHRFHAQIGEMAHNPYLLPSLGRMLIDHTRLSQTFYRPASDEEAERVASAIAQHDAMIDAIARRDASEVVALTVAHWQLSRDRLERFVSPDPLPLDLTPVEDRADAL